MKRLFLLIGLLLGFAASGWAKVTTDTIRFNVKIGDSSDAPRLVYEFYQQTFTIVVEYVSHDGKQRKRGDQDNTRYIQPITDSGQVSIYCTYSIDNNLWYTLGFNRFYPSVSVQFITYNVVISSLEFRTSKLRTVYCEDLLQSTSLDITGRFPRLYCDNLQLPTLDVSGCSNLSFISCHNSRLSSLNVSGCLDLKELYCFDNQLTAVNVSGCLALDGLYCSDCQLKTLNVGELSSLGDLRCGNNQLTTLDISNNKKLRRLDCDNNQLTSLDISNNTALEQLYCDSNQLTTLDVSNNKKLRRLDCRNNQLTSLDVSNDTALEQLYCLNNQLTTLDVSNHTALTSLDCRNNQLTNLDVSGCSALTCLNAWRNHIPLSIVYYSIYKIYLLNSYLCAVPCMEQSDSITIPINQFLDLSSEKIIGERISSFSILPQGFCTEDNFIFQFHEPGQYMLTLKNPALDVITDFAYYISVIIPEGHHRVQVVSNNSEWGSATITGNGLYEEGTEATITATSEWGYRFVNWTKEDGTIFSIEESYTFIVTENLKLTANFEKLPDNIFFVRLSSNDLKWGNVSITGNGIYEEGTEVTITAIPNEGYRFVNWTNGEDVFSTEAVHSFTVTENMELIANFEKIPDDAETFTVILSVNNPEWGVASQIGNGIYEKDEEATIIATPKTGYRFVNWTKGNTIFYTEPVYTFTVTEDLELVASFEKIPDDVANENRKNDNFAVYMQDRTICLSENRGAVQVFNTAGQCIYNGSSTLIPVPNGGVYIVKVGARNYKVVVR